MRIIWAAEKALYQIMKIVIVYLIFLFYANLRIFLKLVWMNWWVEGFNEVYLLTMDTNKAIIKRIFELCEIYDTNITNPPKCR